jgi:hypothetical protein
MLMVTLGFGMIPFGQKVYPWFLICNILISVGIHFGMVAPLLVDYVVKEHQGKAMGVSQIVIAAAYIFSSTGLL